MSEPGGNKELSASLSVTTVGEKPRSESVKVSVDGTEVPIKKGDYLKIKQRGSGTYVFTYIVRVDGFLYDVKTGVIRGVSGVVWREGKKKGSGTWETYSQAWYFGDMNTLELTGPPASS